MTAVITDYELITLESVRELYRWVTECPLASVGDLRQISGRSSGFCFEWLLAMERAGYLVSVPLGCSMRRVRRWYLSESGLAWGSMTGLTWHEEWPRCKLLDRLVLVEWAYPMACSVDNLGHLTHFSWVDNRSYDAIFQYEDGWVAMLWFGLFQTETMLRYRMERLPQEFASMGVFADRPWPGLFMFLVPDEWQRELVYRVARDMHFEDRVAVWCIADGSRYGAAAAMRSRGLVHPRVELKSTGGWNWERRLQQSYMSGNAGSAMTRILEVVGEWPDVSSQDLAGMMGPGYTGDRVTLLARSLREWDLLEVRMDGRLRRYRLSGRGRDCLARRDRVRYRATSGLSSGGSGRNMERLSRHEAGVMSLSREFMEQGLSVAAGWRSWEHLADGGIAPDAMVYLPGSPAGGSWHYIEYERSARGYARISRKLAGYAYDLRQDRWPVLVVCWDESAESIFEGVADGEGIRMIITTIGRLAEHGALGNDRCWRYRGSWVRLG